jgi:hypothetical protein
MITPRNPKGGLTDEEKRAVKITASFLMKSSPCHQVLSTWLLLELAVVQTELPFLRGSTPYNYAEEKHAAPFTGPKIKYLTKSDLAARFMTLSSKD